MKSKALSILTIIFVALIGLTGLSGCQRAKGTTCLNHEGEGEDCSVIVEARPSGFDLGVYEGNNGREINITDKRWNSLRGSINRYCKQNPPNGRRHIRYQDTASPAYILVTYRPTGPIDFKYYSNDGTNIEYECKVQCDQALILTHEKK